MSRKSKEPRRVVSIAAFDADGELLFGKRADTGKWTLPGGHLEEGEEPMDGAKRELLEESGLEGQDWQYLGRGLAGRDGSCLVYAYRCVVEGQPSAENDPDEEMATWQWVDGELPEEISSNLHSPKNVTLRLLGLQEGEVDEPLEKKADPHFIEKNPYSGSALRIPKNKTRSRVQWDKDYLQSLAHHFAGGDVKRLRPVQVPTDANMGSNMAVNKSRLALYKRMIKAKDRLPPVVVKRVGLGWHLLDGNHRLEAARHSKVPMIHAVEVLDPPLKKGLTGAVAGLGMMALGQASPQLKAAFDRVNPPTQQVQAAPQQPAFTKWHPDGLSEDLIPVAHLESSWGKNLAHASNSKGQFHTAFGALGFKPVTAHEEYLKSKYLQGKYPDLAAPESFLKTFQNDPKFYNLLASAHFARLKHRHGDAQKAAYAWRWGTGATLKATPEQIQNDSYVQKYTHIALDHKTGKQKMPDPLTKAEPLAKMAVKPIKPKGSHPPDPNAGVSPGGVKLDTHERHDYSNHLDPKHQKQGYSLHVFAGHDRGEGLQLAFNPLRLNARIYHNGVQVGDAEGSVHNGDLLMSYGSVDDVARGQGFGQKMYEALYAHGANFHGVRTVSGGVHSSSAHDMHERISQEHGFRYKAKPNDWVRPELKGKVSGDFDDAWGDYEYAIKSEGKTFKWAYHGTDPSNLASIQAQGLRPSVASGTGPKTPRVFISDEHELAGDYGDLVVRFPWPHAAESFVGEDSGITEYSIPHHVEPELIQYHNGTSWVPLRPRLKKSEQHDPLEAMLAHDDPQERIMALRSSLVTPYHLRLALQDEDPDVRVFAAKHPMMTSALIEATLRHGDLATREAILSRPDLQEHHLEQAIWDPDLQTQAALHPGLTEDQRIKIANSAQAPEGLRDRLLAKNVGYLTYPKLGQPSPQTEPMIRDRAAHQRWLKARTGIKDPGNVGAISYNRLRSKGLADDRRRMSASVRADAASLPTALRHETQHSVFAHLRQTYGNEAGYRIVASTLAALDPKDHEHLRRVTDWQVQNKYGPTQEPEERIAYLQNYLQDSTWRKSAHKHMRIHMDPNAEKVSHDWAKQIWSKLRLRAESLGPEHVGVIRKAEDEISAWVLRRSEEKDDHSVAEDMMGLNAKNDAALEAAKFLAGGKEPDQDLFRQALLADETVIDAALISVDIEPTKKNRDSLKAVLELQTVTLEKAEKKAREVHAMMPDGAEVADGVRRGFDANTDESLHLGGKHSRGSLMVKDPDTQEIYLLKPGSGGQSPAAGAMQEHANQSRREAAFWHAADDWGLSQRFPRADLVLIDGQEVAVLHMLPFDWKNLEKLRDQDLNLPHRALEKYRQTGELHKWAILDYVLGNPDRHGQNLMVGPAKDNYPIALIDHGSAFAGPSFDPAFDQKSFIPYYLRAWRADSWATLTPEQRFRAMPVVSGDTERQLREWFHGIHAHDLEALLVRYGIDPQPSLDRLARVHRALGEPNFSEAINRLWLKT